MSFRKEEGKDILTFGFTELLEQMKSSIKSIEIYYNPYKTILENKVEGATYYNIYTKEEISL